MENVLFAAEIGLNHDGDWDLARELVRQAAEAGADIAKFQLGWRSDPGEMNEIDVERATWLKSWCQDQGIEFLASVFDEDSLKIAREVGMDRYKIASRTVVDEPELCEEILAEGRETFISLGMWDGDGYPFDPPDEKRVRYLYCVSEYPTYPDDLDLPDRFEPQGLYGYSDHTLGIDVPLLAIARGARYIEKHFTINKGSKTIRDHVLSATPDEFATLVDVGTSMARTRDALGD